MATKGGEVKKEREEWSKCCKIGLGAQIQLFFVLSTVWFHIYSMIVVVFQFKNNDHRNATGKTT